MSAGERQFQVMPGGHAAGREMPASEEAEEHVLACCLLEGSDTIKRALIAGVRPETFFWPRNIRIFEVIVSIFRTGQPVTLEVLAEELASRQLLDEIGGFPYLMQITAKIPTTAHASYFIDKIREKSALRWLIMTGTALVEKAYGCPGGPELPDLMQKHLTEMSRGLSRVLRAEQLPVGLQEQCDQVAHEFKTRREGKEDRRGWIYTGMPAFDEKLMPFGSQLADHLIMLAGGSGDGKSTLAIQWAGVALARGQRVRAYTKETGSAVFLMTLAAQNARVDMRKPADALRERSDKFMAECERMKIEWADSRLTCVEQTGATPLATIEDLEDDARMFKRLQGDVHLWVVDYAQIFGTRKRCNSREEINAIIAGKLQTLCRELGGVWLVLLQMNEKGLAEMRQLHRDAKGKVIHRMPHRGDLRESQAYYHACDRCLFIYRPPIDCRDQEQTSPSVLKPEQWIVQDKRRRGGRGYTRNWFEMVYGTFDPFSGSYDSLTSSSASMAKQQFKGERGGGT